MIVMVVVSHQLSLLHRRNMAFLQVDQRTHTSSYAYSAQSMISIIPESLRFMQNCAEINYNRSPAQVGQFYGRSSQVQAHATGKSLSDRRFLS